MNNIPAIKLGLISVSRDCFPIELSAARRHAVAAACSAIGVKIYDCPVTVENDLDAQKAVNDVLTAGVNALVIYLGCPAHKFLLSLILYRSDIINAVGSQDYARIWARLNYRQQEPGGHVFIYTQDARSDMRRHDLRHELVLRVRLRLAQEVRSVVASGHQLVIGGSNAAGGQNLPRTPLRPLRRSPRSP